MRKQVRAEVLETLRPGQMVMSRIHSKASRSLGSKCLTLICAISATTKTITGQVTFFSSLAVGFVAIFSVPLTIITIFVGFVAIILLLMKRYKEVRAVSKLCDTVELAIICSKVLELTYLSVVSLRVNEFKASVTTEDDVEISIRVDHLMISDLRKGQSIAQSELLSCEQNNQALKVVRKKHLTSVEVGKV